VDVEVAVLLAAVEPLEAPAELNAQTGLDVRWAERPKVLLSVSLESELREILDRAASHFGIVVVPSPGRDTVSVSDVIDAIAFYRDDADEGTKDVWEKLAVLDEDGRIEWVTDFRELTMERLIASAEAGLIQGDPTRIYLVPYPPQGIISDLDWPAVLETLETVDNVLIHIGATYAGLQGIIAVFRKAGAVLASSWRNWARRDGGLEDVQRLARSKGWQPDDLAERLGVTNTDAELLLRMFGCVPTDNGAWVPGTDERSRTAAALVTAIWYALDVRITPNEESMQRMVLRVIEGLVTAPSDNDRWIDNIAFRAVEQEFDWEPPS
jgi:hypothetical protein